MLPVEDLKVHLIDGLFVDGAHHKQWYLEKALEMLGVNLDDLREHMLEDDFDWEKGICP